VAEKKISRKELVSEPDEFITYTGRAIEYVRENPGHAVAAVAVVLIIVVAVSGYFWYQKSQSLTSHNAFERAWRQYEAMTAATEPPSAEKLDQLFSAFDQVAKLYPSLPAGEKALLYSGHVLYRKKDYQAALERYNKMQNTSFVKRGLGPMILYHVAETRLALKDYEQAVVMFDQLTKDKDSPYKREAYGSVARIYELMKKDKEALQAYRQYLKLFPEAPDASYVKARIADLSVQG